MEEQTFGIPVNGHAVSILIKEMIRRAFEIIEQERSVFTVEAKKGYGGDDDLATSADKKAQEHIVKLTQESLPGFGIIAEEEGGSLPCGIPGRDLYLTIDPVDGTRAYNRKQSHGIGSQIALIEGDQVLGAWAGDCNTFELYYYRPGSNKVHRVRNAMRLSDHYPMRVDEGLSLREQYVLLREREADHHPLIRRAITRQDRGGLFKNLQINGGSIVTFMAQLWKGEVGAVAFVSGHDTPWDLAPIYGISQKMGFQFWTPSEDGTKFVPYDVKIPREPTYRAQQLLIIHKSRTDELIRWCNCSHRSAA